MPEDKVAMIGSATVAPWPGLAQVDGSDLELIARPDRLLQEPDQLGHAALQGLGTADVQAPELVQVDAPTVVLELLTEDLVHQVDQVLDVRSLFLVLVQLVVVVEVDERHEVRLPRLVLRETAGREVRDVVRAKDKLVGPFPIHEGGVKRSEQHQGLNQHHGWVRGSR